MLVTIDSEEENFEGVSTLGEYENYDFDVDDVGDGLSAKYRPTRKYKNRPNAKTVWSDYRESGRDRYYLHLGKDESKKRYNLEILKGKPDDLKITIHINDYESENTSSEIKDEIFEVITEMKGLQRVEFNNIHTLDIIPSYRIVQLLKNQELKRIDATGRVPYKIGEEFDLAPINRYRAAIALAFYTHPNIIRLGNSYNDLTKFPFHNCKTIERGKPTCPHCPQCSMDRNRANGHMRRFKLFYLLYFKWLHLDADGLSQSERDLVHLWNSQ